VFPILSEASISRGCASSCEERLNSYLSTSYCCKGNLCNDTTDIKFSKSLSLIMIMIFIAAKLFKNDE
jgi:hypothetical protein